MSYFNQDQEDYMKYLSSLKPEKKCLCGWEHRGKCFNESCIRGEPDRILREQTEAVEQSLGVGEGAL